MTIGNGSVALGSESKAIGVFSVALGTYSKAAEENTVSVGNGKTKRRIVNVEDGIKANDAATVGKLEALMARIEALEAKVSSHSR